MFNYIGISGILILLIAGAIVGLCVAGTDLINPTTSQAEARRMDVETRHLETMHQLEEQRVAAKTEAEIARIRHQQELEEARYQAELARIAADQAHYKRMLVIQANIYKGAMTMLLIVAGSAMMMLIFIGTRFALVRIQPVSSTLPATPPAAKRTASPAQPRQHSPNGYEQMRIQARQRELLDRYITLQRVHDACNPKGMSRKEYDKLPLAQ